VSAPSTDTWTGRLRRLALESLAPEELLPDTQPDYVASWVYVFGVLTLAALIVVIASGCVLALEGPSWWHLSKIGHFFNSMHLWSVELFFFFMVIHLWAKFFMAAWRGHRQMTWITGAVAFVVSTRSDWRRSPASASRSTRPRTSCSSRSTWWPPTRPT
jgi:ubiquinol-cytochrome c reductase cytochrome b subunit